MAKKTHNMFHGQFVFEGKNLIPRGGSTKYEAFLKTLEQGQSVEVFLESNPDDGTLTQIAKIHVVCRKLASEIGYTFKEMKLEVKKQSGLCVVKQGKEDKYLVCKSIGDCSKEELSLVLVTLSDMCQQVGITFD
jgi:hypothetical protein